MKKVKDLKEIDAQIGECMDNPNAFPGMSYVEGVQAALEWVIGLTDTAPMED